MNANRKDINTAANGVKMEHRHFAAIAATIAKCKPVGNADPAAVEMWRDMQGAFRAMCSASNPRFDADRFNRACNASD